MVLPSYCATATRGFVWHFGRGYVALPFRPAGQSVAHAATWTEKSMRMLTLHSTSCNDQGYSSKPERRSIWIFYGLFEGEVVELTRILFIKLVEGAGDHEPCSLQRDNYVP